MILPGKARHFCSWPIQCGAMAMGDLGISDPQISMRSARFLVPGDRLAIGFVVLDTSGSAE